MAAVEKPRILVTGTIHRGDLLSMFERSIGRVDFSFVEYFDPAARADVYAPFGPLRCWHEFRDARALLDELRPDKLAMMANTSLNQLALIAHARERGIRVIHLEHGYRFAAHEKATSAFDLRPRPFSSLRRVLAGQRDLVRTHAFFFRSLASLPAAVRRQLANFALRYYLRGESMALHTRFAALRRPDEYIEFSPGTFSFHESLDDLGALPVRPPVTFVGIPYFDDLAVVAGARDPRTVLLIDHPLHHSPTRPFGWTMEYRPVWVKALAGLIKKHRLRLLVKEHPIDTTGSWAPYLEPGTIELVDREGMREALRSVSLVLGTFSTLQLPLAAMPHVAMIVLEIHPEPDSFPGRQLVEAGVASQVTSFEELDAQLAARDEIWLQQSSAKARFETEFLFRFDGRAGERLADALTAGELRAGGSAHTPPHS